VRTGRVAALFAAFAALGAGCGSPQRPPAAGLPVVVLSSHEAPAWVRLLRAAGFAAREGTLGDLLGRTGGVVPADAALSGSDRSKLVRWVARGGRLATAQDQVIAALGIVRAAAASVAGVRMKLLAGTAQWTQPIDVRALGGAKLTALATSAPGARIVMAAERSGRGEVVALAVDPVGGGRAGYELLPDAAALVGEALQAPAGPKAQAAEIFVDPGGLRAAERDPARIAALLAQAGARVAEIAAWNYDFTDPAADYDYASLIRALHARGILAYAWLEPPFVTLRLWQDHPECREKTETGRDARVGWRSLIALEDPACFALATQSWSRVLTRYLWDGVNVAELYFEPLADGARSYTPFSASALAEFGRPPASDPSGFARFRTRLATRLNRDVLDFVATLPHATRLGRELTVIDDTLDPVMGRAVGSDVAALATIATRAGASLVVEDPHSTWTDGPLRYDTLGPHVASLMPPEASLIDVNVVPRYGAKPTSQMTGSELALALDSATASTGRLGLYSLGTLSPGDIAALPGATAGSTSTTDLGIYGRWTVKVTAPTAADARLDVDGIPWPAAGGVALVPPGNHVLHWASGPPRGPGLVAFTGQIGTARAGARSLDFSYETHPDGLAVVTQRPTSVRIDGAPAQLDSVADPGGGYVVRLPAGKHLARLGF
jgi:hypothetical protein